MALSPGEISARGSRLALGEQLLFQIRKLKERKKKKKREKLSGKLAGELSRKKSKKAKKLEKLWKI